MALISFLLFVGLAYAWPPHGVATGTAPSNTSLPTISSSSPIVGTPETITTGSWSGTPTITYACQVNWADTSTPISGATSCSSYTPVSGDVGHTLDVTVGATNSYGGPIYATSTATGAVSSGSANVAFTALHTYFMSPTGNDSNSGTDAAHPWATPNHAVKCGDVILAASGSYSGGWGTWGAVSNCPSTSGGIDGTGGVYFATILCAGSTLGSCTMTSTGGDAFNMPVSNWAVEGWNVTNGGIGYRGFNVNGCSTKVHHFAFVNDVVYASGSAVHTDDCGVAGSTFGADYVASVGIIAQNAAINTLCEAAIDAVGPTQFDSGAGTHIYFFNNYTWANSQTSCTSYDAEAIMFDSWDAHPNNQQGVIANNIVWDSMRYCIQFTEANGTYSANAPIMKTYNNTCYADLQNVFSDFADGEINIQPGEPWHISIDNNIALTKGATSGSGQSIYALVIGGGTNANTTIGASGANVLKGSSTTCGGTCDSGNNVSAFDGNSYGSNTYINPGFNNTTDLFANWLGVPNCSSYANTTACMGYNAATSTLSANTPIYDLKPTAVGTTGKGFQLPSTTCAANADYPTWLKGVVYLHWDGSQIWENADLVSKPCGL